jgi:hypothetical protein
MVADGFGFTDIVTVKLLPTQEPAVGVSVYTAFACVVPELLSVCTKFDDAVAEAVASENPVPVGRGQVNVVPEGIVPFVPLVGVTVTVFSVHNEAVMLFTKGVAPMVMANGELAVLDPQLLLAVAVKFPDVDVLLKFIDDDVVVPEMVAPVPV